MLSELISRGYCLWPDFIDPDLARALRQDAARLQALGAFKNAGIGQGADFQIRPEVRRDEIHWLSEPSDNPAQTGLWSRLRALQTALNRELYLGLQSFEGHYAYYPEGGFYRRHRDAFARDDSRMISLILYLNENWQPAQAGQLRMHAPNGPLDVEPRSGTLVLFLSRELEHEVLQSHAPRLSFTGWFKTGASIGPR